MPNEAKSGYFESKAVRKQERVKSSDYTLLEHIDEAITLSAQPGCDNRVRFHLLPAVLGRRVSAVIPRGACVATACTTVLVPKTGEKLSLHTGVLQAANAKITSAVVGARIDLVCRKKGEWDCDNAVGTWIVTTY